MVGIYKISNRDKGTDIKINEILIIDLIKVLDKRSATLQRKMIEIWETLEQEEFDYNIIKKR